ncbi:protocadherin gamma-C5-like isoform X25 [Hyperolius riggenbachi]|uniref:protocadherin gamma-C5-like isoform X25 n=1 Tax=Hyperolius riggenbachi TaxID=752182 RepID=UPI0035A38C7E
MDIQVSKLCEWQVLFLLFLCSWGWVSGQLRYSVVEESEPGTFVGNVAQDLKLNVADLSKRRLRLGLGKSTKYFSVNHKNGELVVNEKVDRETLCGSGLSCSLTLEIITEQPLELYSLEIEVVDINDNSPSFSTHEQIIKIYEALAIPGTRFPLESAKDPDIGSNGVSQYMLSESLYFSLSSKKRKDGTILPELVIEKSLDREEIARHKLLITAVDNGKPPKAGTSQITVIILDSNDNAPIFDHSVYKVTLPENTPPGTVVVKLNATDFDEGLNGEVEYFFDYHTLDSIKKIFDLNQQTGIITMKSTLDFEEADSYEISVRAKDKGELESRCIVAVEIEDINDNAPEISLTSLVNSVPENAAVGTAVGFLSVKDHDSGKNGEVTLELSPNLPFKIKPFNNRYSIVTDGVLDREKVSQYTLTLIATDLGSPPLRNQTSIVLDVFDVNDNPPTFSQPHFNAFVEENSEPGTLLYTVCAFDLDEGLNSQLSFSIVEAEIEGTSVTSFVYINTNNGNIYAQRSFDYESVQVLQISVKVEDAGSPKLSSTTDVFIFILDKNDNAPQVLYPEYSRDYISHQRMPKFASSGAWITKVTAIDADSGRNGWLFFKIQDATEPSLFQISTYTGEIRSSRAFQESDQLEQRLVVSVRDHGEPPMSSTVTIVLTLEDQDLQENPQTHTFLSNTPIKTNMTLYLIISLVAISLVSLVTFILLIVRCVRKNTYYDSYWCCAKRTPPIYYTEPYKPTLHLNADGTLKYMEVKMEPTSPRCQTLKTRLAPTDKKDFTFLRSPNFPQMQTVVSETEVLTGINGLNEYNQQVQPNSDWRFSQAQRPGPSGAQPTEEAGVWPNNQFETERLQAMILASANEAAEGTSGLGGSTGTMGLSARYGPQFTLQHVPDYRQNVYIPGSTLTPTNAAGKRDGKGGGNKKKSGKKDKK